MSTNERYLSRCGPSVWHLLYLADIRVRSEHMERETTKAKAVAVMLWSGHGATLAKPTLANFGLN